MPKQCSPLRPPVVQVVHQARHVLAQESQVHVHAVASDLQLKQRKSELQIPRSAAAWFSRQEGQAHMHTAALLSAGVQRPATLCRTCAVPGSGACCCTKASTCCSASASEIVLSRHACIGCQGGKA